MLTLKQAFSVAALQQNARSQSQQCDSCPMQQLHRLCERMEGTRLTTRSQIIFNSSLHFCWKSLVYVSLCFSHNVTFILKPTDLWVIFIWLHLKKKVALKLFRLRKKCDPILFWHFFSGLHPSQVKLELQRHLASLDNHEQASVFENTKVGDFLLLWQFSTLLN